MHWIIGQWISTRTPGCVRPPVEKPSLKLLANQATNHLSHVQANVKCNNTTSKCVLEAAKTSLGNANGKGTLKTVGGECPGVDESEEPGSPPAIPTPTSTYGVGANY
ncbi:hypothetical protein ACTXT7_010626 [Hymenolepis weldensis]